MAPGGPRSQLQLSANYTEDDNDNNTATVALQDAPEVHKNRRIQSCSRSRELDQSQLYIYSRSYLYSSLSTASTEFFTS